MTDQYTPSTDEVRGVYVASNFRSCFESSGPTQAKKEWVAEFDRWLAAHDAEVRAEAWDEGFTSGGYWGDPNMPTHRDPQPTADNPYRAQNHTVHTQGDER